MYVYAEDWETIHPIFSVSGGDTEMADFSASEYQISTKHLTLSFFLK